MRAQTGSKADSGQWSQGTLDAALAMKGRKEADPGLVCKPVIPDAQEAETKRSQVQGQPGQVSEISSENILGIYNILTLKGRGSR